MLDVIDIDRNNANADSKEAAMSLRDSEVRGVVEQLGARAREKGSRSVPHTT
jgi:hypothetical protein